MSSLIIMRHGQSIWTAPSENRFAGWVDVPLNDIGRQQARYAGSLLSAAHLAPTLVMTSVLERSIETAQLVVQEIDQPWLSVERSWRLNERHYGAFQGETRPVMRERYGETQFQFYRRGYDIRPPEIALDSPYYQGADPRYEAIFTDGLSDEHP